MEQTTLVTYVGGIPNGQKDEVLEEWLDKGWYVKSIAPFGLNNMYMLFLLERDEF